MPESSEEAISRPITEVTVEDVEVSCRDFVAFLSHLITLRRLLWVGVYFALFISIGYFYKLWLWVDMCVLERTGVPCREDYRLFSSPYPLALGAAYGDETNFSRSFFSLDFPHLLCCFYGLTTVTLWVGVPVYCVRRWVIPPIISAVRRSKVALTAHRRRELSK